MTGSNDTICPLCGEQMVPEHAHYKCPDCKFILPCCEGGEC